MATKAYIARKQRIARYVRAGRPVPEHLWHELHQDEIDREIARYREWQQTAQEAGETPLADAMEILAEKLREMRPRANSFPQIGTRPTPVQTPEVRAKRAAAKRRQRANRKRRLDQLRQME